MQGLWGAIPLHLVLQQGHPLCPRCHQGQDHGMRSVPPCQGQLQLVEENGQGDMEVESHFAVPTHLTEEHWDTLRALMTTLDMLSMDFLAFQQDSWNLSVSILRVVEAIADKLQRSNNLKEEAMGKSKGKGKEEEEEPRRRRMEDKDGDMEMDRAGPSSLV
ncbi:hypothetical protein ID866_10295 [Astraeus odoratus]|nr:hypothetical protein ID866_10295 [Astraeus odoratus]